MQRFLIFLAVALIASPVGTKSSDGKPDIPDEIALDCELAFKAIGPGGKIQVANWDDYSLEGLQKLAVHRVLESVAKQDQEWTGEHNQNFDQVAKSGYRMSVFLLASEEPFDWESGQSSEWKIANDAAGDKMEFHSAKAFLVEGYPKNEPRLFPLVCDIGEDRFTKINNIHLASARQKQLFWSVAVFKCRPNDPKGLEPRGLTAELWPCFNQDVCNQFKLVRQRATQ